VALLSESWRSLKSVETETLAGQWVTVAVVALTEMVVVARQDDPVEILEIATKRVGVEEVDNKSTDERTDGQITKIEEAADPKIEVEADPNEAPTVSVVAAELAEGLKVAILPESMKAGRAVKVAEEVHHDTVVAARMGGRSCKHII
jgi:hypothetical protein